MKHVDIFTDGACSGNPGPGGWGAILRAGSDSLASALAIHAALVEGLQAAGLPEAAIQVVPVPASLAVATLGGLVASRRRRT